MSITLSTVNFSAAQDKIRRELERFRGTKAVTVGIHEGAGAAESGDITMASLGAVHEFGADINHPGGTDYGYATKAAAERGEVRFLKSGTGYMTLGKTAAHKIVIPARPWLEPGVESATPLIIETIANGITDGLTPDETLEAVGLEAVGAVKQFMTDLKTPPNAASTIRQKGSSNPLIDKGHLRALITHEVSSKRIEEGLQ